MRADVGGVECPDLGRSPSDGFWRSDKSERPVSAEDTRAGALAVDPYHLSGLRAARGGRRNHRREGFGRGARRGRAYGRLTERDRELCGKAAASSGSCCSQSSQRLSLIHI
eukprot:5846254-Prymnesium_polylepis.1